MFILLIQMKYLLTLIKHYKNIIIYDTDMGAEMVFKNKRV